ncbi:str-85 [Pristionchus pacificus]|uniref:Str-85 n=1 Tax=Pristionchus pacificus TaxID=54126 RepID=A0A2A6BVR1_PRIPA|nr:str-85 [Pristionchus pacificus]|eukprot:PDM69957.1 str-85 [Pristionchus pacificus]
MNIDVLSRLEKCPREITWKIIEFAPEQFLNVSMTCSMLKSHVDQCARGRVNIPIIDRLRFNGGKIPSCYRNIAQAMADTDPIYSFIYKDPFHKIIIETTTAIALFSNSLLIFIVTTTKADHIGSYRYLLVFFSICNITTTFGHVSMEWYCHLTSTGFYFFPRHVGGFFFGTPWASIFCWMFIVTYYQVFLILAYHFIYRFKTVTRGIGSSFTDGWKSTNWVCAAIITYVVYITAFVSDVAFGMAPSEQMRNDVPPEILEIYGMDLKDPRTGFIVIAMRRVNHTTNEVYWSAESVISIIICMILFLGTGAVVVFCISKTSAAIKSTNTTMAPATRRMQQQLFRALLIQTFIPCIFSYSPLCMILLWGGLTGINLGAFGNVLFLTTAVFPSVDAFFVLFFIVKFRIAVIKLFLLPFSTIIGSSVEHRSNTLTR